jgi:hypothetical protein
MSILAQALTYVVVVYAISLPVSHAFCALKDRRRQVGRNAYLARPHRSRDEKVPASGRRAAHRGSRFPRMQVLDRALSPVRPAAISK